MIYIIHFDEPLAHARHYVGYYKRGNLKRRLEEHRSGRGARILEVCNERGITYRVVRLMPGDRNRERQIKNAKCTPRYCPECRAKFKKQNTKLMDILFPTGEGVFDAESSEYNFLKMISGPRWTNPDHIQQILDDWVTWDESDRTVEIFLDHDEMNEMNQYAFEISNRPL